MYHLHDPLQSAYKTQHSTETAFTKVYNDLLGSIDRHGVAILILLNISAAFDTIDQQVLLDRMKFLLGIDGTVLAWFASYLTDRTQYVNILEANIGHYPVVVWCTARVRTRAFALFDIYSTTSSPHYVLRA